jgi:SAM-dependent methyltransferase
MKGSVVLGLGALFGLVGAYAAWDIFHIVTTKEVAFEEAKRLSGGKGIINIGAGPNRTFGAQVVARDPEVVVNIDIEPDGLPNFIQLDAQREPLPFADKQFGVAYCSHVLEHLDNWEFALNEMERVADYVVIVLPDPQYFSGWLDPEHKQHFSTDDIDQILQLYSNVTVYY